MRAGASPASAWRGRSEWRRWPRADVARGRAEGMGPIAGTHITALYGFDRRAVGHFSTCVDPPSKGARFGLTVHGNARRGPGSRPARCPPRSSCPTPAGSPAASRAAWQEITSAGPGQGRAAQGQLAPRRQWLDRPRPDRGHRGATASPRETFTTARAALEMILAVYESHRLRGPADLPLKKPPSSPDDDLNGTDSSSFSREPRGERATATCPALARGSRLNEGG